MNKFAKMLELILGTKIYPEIAEEIMWRITASELAYVLDLLGILDTFPYKRAYLNPLRDMDPCMEINKLAPPHMYTTLIIGPDMDRFMMRIKKPKIYWGVMECRYKSPIERGLMNDIKAWVVCINRRFGETVSTITSTIADSPDDTAVIQPGKIHMEMNPYEIPSTSMTDIAMTTISPSGSMCPITRVSSFAFDIGTARRNMIGGFIKVGNTSVAMNWDRLLFRKGDAQPVKFAYINAYDEHLRVHHPRSNRQQFTRVNQHNFEAKPAPDNTIRFAYARTSSRTNATDPATMNANIFESMYIDVPMSI